MLLLVFIVLLIQSSLVSARIESRSPFEFSLGRAVENNNKEFLQELLESESVNVNQREYLSGNTLLHKAVELKNIELVQLLLTYGADPTIRNARGDTPVHGAVKDNSLMIIKELAPVSLTALNMRDSDDLTPLMSAILRCNYEIVSELVSNGANLSVPLDLSHKTHWALHTFFPKIVSSEGINALDLAELRLYFMPEPWMKFFKNSALMSFIAGSLLVLALASSRSHCIGCCAKSAAGLSSLGLITTGLVLQYIADSARKEIDADILLKELTSPVCEHNMRAIIELLNHAIKLDSTVK